MSFNSNFHESKNTDTCGAISPHIHAKFSSFIAPKRLSFSPPCIFREPATAPLGSLISLPFNDHRTHDPRCMVLTSRKNVFLLVYPEKSLTGQSPSKNPFPSPFQMGQLAAGFTNHPEAAYGQPDISPDRRIARRIQHPSRATPTQDSRRKPTARRVPATGFPEDHTNSHPPCKTMQLLHDS